MDLVRIVSGGADARSAHSASCRFPRATTTTASLPKPNMQRELYGGTPMSNYGIVGRLSLSSTGVGHNRQELLETCTLKWRRKVPSTLDSEGPGRTVSNFEDMPILGHIKFHITMNTTSFQGSGTPVEERTTNIWVVVNHRNTIGIHRGESSGPSHSKKAIEQKKP